LNLHGIPPITTSTLRVYQFRHGRSQTNKAVLTDIAQIKNNQAFFIFIIFFLFLSIFFDNFDKKTPCTHSKNMVYLLYQKKLLENY